MGLFARLLGLENAGDRNPTDDFWFGPLALPNAADYPVTLETALQLPAVSGSLQLISEDCAKLPVVVFRRTKDGKRERLDDHPAAKALRNPNLTDTRFDFIAQMVFDLAWYRNAYAEIILDARGEVEQLKPIPAADTVVSRSPGGAILYSYPDPMRPGFTRVLREGQVWHLKRGPLTPDRLAGRPVHETHKEPIAAALGCQDYAARFFANDSKNGGIVKTPPGFKFKSDLDRNNWLRAWQASGTRGNRHKDRFLEFGFGYERIAHSPDESQFIQTRLSHDVAIARIWRVPPHKIGILDRATFSNIEQQSIEYVTDCLVSLLTLIEQSISKFLIIEEDVFAVFNVAALLRGDTLQRYQSYGIARNWGWLSVNDVRRLEDMDPIGTDGDEYLRPANTVQLGEEVAPKPGEGSGQQPPMPREEPDDEEARAAWRREFSAKPNGSLSSFIFPEKQP